MHATGSVCYSSKVETIILGPWIALSSHRYINFFYRLNCSGSNFFDLRIRNNWRKYDSPFERETPPNLVWTILKIALGPSLLFFIMACLSPFGIFTRHTEFKSDCLLSAGRHSLELCYCIRRFIHSGITWHFTGYTLGSVCTGVIPGIYLISKWFNVHRGIRNRNFHRRFWFRRHDISSYCGLFSANNVVARGTQWQWQE